MRISKIHLDNFRQFVDTTIEFGDSRSRQFDLLVANNEVGKTTLISAIFLAFHGLVHPSLSEPDYLINNQVFEFLPDGDTASLSIDIEFTHGENSEIYLLHRYLKVQRQGTRQEIVANVANLVNKSTETPIEPAQRWINSHFPRNLANFLLIPGERLRELLDKSDLSSAGSDIKALTGLDRVGPMLEAADLIIQSIDKDLRGLPGEGLASDLTDQASGTRLEIGKTIESIQKLEEDLARARSEQRQHAEFVGSRQAESTTLLALLRINDQIPKLESNLESALRQQTALVQDFGWLAFLSTFATEAAQVVREKQKAGLLGGSWDKSLITSLIESHTCVCGRALDKYSSETLQTHLEHSDSLLNEAAYRKLLAFGPDGGLAPDKAEFAWVDLNHKIFAAQGELSDLLAEKAVLQSAPGVTDDEGFLLSRSRRLEDLTSIEIPALQEKLSQSQSKLEILRAKLAGLEEDVNKAKSSGSTAERLHRQRSAMIHVRDSIAYDAANLQSLLASRIEMDLQASLPKILFEPDLEISLDRNFGVSLTKKGAPRPLSEGGRKVLGFSLITALYRAARYVSESQMSLSEPLELPFVLDAPFSDLDSGFFKSTLELFKSSANQVIFLLRPEHATSLLEHSASDVGSRLLAHWQKSCPPTEHCETLYDSFPDANHKILKIEYLPGKNEVVCGPLEVIHVD